MKIIKKEYNLIDNTIKTSVLFAGKYNTDELLSIIKNLTKKIQNKNTFGTLDKNIIVNENMKSTIYTDEFIIEYRIN